MKGLLRVVGYFGWVALLLVPSDMWRLWVVMALAPAWSVVYLHVFVPQGGVR